MTDNSDSHSSFSLRRVSGFFFTFRVSCDELSQPMGKTEFSSTAGNRTNSVSNVRKRCLATKRNKNGLK